MRIDATRDRLVYQRQPGRPGGKSGIYVELLPRHWGQGHVAPHLFRWYMERERLSNKDVAEILGVRKQTVGYWKTPAGFRNSREIPVRLFKELVKTTTPDWGENSGLKSVFPFLN